MKMTLNWDKIAELGETDPYKDWYDDKEIPYNTVFTAVEDSPSLKGPTNTTIRVIVGKSYQTFYRYALMPVVEAKPLEDWM